MIDLFEINVNDLEKSRYKKFVSKVLDNTKFQEKIEKADKEFKLVVDKHITPKQKRVNILYYVSMITMFLTLIMALLLIQNIDKKPFPVVYLVLSIASLVAVVVSSIFQYRCKKSLDAAMKCDEVRKATEKNKEIEGELVKELGIPEGTTKVDIFVRQVFIKNDAYYNAIRQSYANYGLYAYVKNNKLCFSDTYEVIDFGLNEVKKVKLINERISFDHWNKKENPRDKKFSQYKIRFQGRGGILINCFYQIEIERDGSEYKLLLPGYEKEFVESIFNVEDIIVEEKRNENKQ